MLVSPGGGGGVPVSPRGCDGRRVGGRASASASRAGSPRPLLPRPVSLHCTSFHQVNLYAPILDYLLPIVLLHFFRSNNLYRLFKYD